MTGRAEPPAGLVGSLECVDMGDTAAEVMTPRAASAVGLFERATSHAGQPWEESPDLGACRRNPWANIAGQPERSAEGAEPRGASA